MPKWTSEQELAINERGSNIIVSAGAGSGKTAVLSERILKIVRDDKKSVKNLIVLTFTKAAALEMKVRIYDKLVKNNLLEEASLVYASDITTFDAYSLSIVQKYYYKLGLSNNISISEEDVVEEKIRSIINDVFSEYYNNNDQKFINLLKHQALKCDDKLVNLFVDLHKRLSLMPDTNKYLDTYLDTYFSDEFIDKLVLEFNDVVMKSVIVIKLLVDELCEAFANSNLNQEEKLKQYSNAISQITSFDDIVIPKNLSANDHRKASDELKALFKEYNGIIKDLMEDIKKYKDRYTDLFGVKEQILNSKDDIRVIIDVAKRVEDEIFLYKKKYGAFTFNDIAKMAIKLVKMPEIKKEYKENIYEILVDEYQDTSDLQEAFLSEIANDNLYMVGDIKQSIYRFRNANPYIFKNKYDSYALLNGGKKIDLLKNFRSRSEVLDNINKIFNNIMSDVNGDANYKADHQMNYGLSLYDEQKDNINYSLEDYIYDTNNVDLEDLEEDELQVREKLSNDEIEAFIAAKIIKDNLKNNVFDKEKSKLRPAKFSDFAIIIDRATTFKLYQKIFEYNQIPLEIVGDVTIKESTFLLSMINLLDLYKGYLSGAHLLSKDNNLYKKFNLSLVGLLRSFIFEMSDEDIYKIINNELEFNIIDRFKNIHTDISSELQFLELLKEFDVYNKLSIIGNVDNSLIEINTIYSKLASYNELGYSFIESVDLLVDMINKQKDIKITPDKDNIDAVKIMTIHKSKGLEYPYCIFSGLAKKFNDADSKAQFGVSDKYGIFIKSYINGKLESNIIQLLNSLDVTAKDQSEKIRLFYVALTRAREKMFLIRPFKENKGNVMDCNSLNDLFNMASSNEIIGNRVYITSDKLYSEYNASKDYTKNNKQYKINCANKKINYKNIDFTSKILYKQDISHRVNNILTNEEKENLEYGTKLHEILESLDFNNLSLNHVDVKYHDKIKNLLALDIFKDIDKANVYQEHEFYYSDNTKSYNGIIDLLVEHDDEFIIIDYKTSDIDNPAYVEQLRQYYNYVKLNSNKKIRVFLLSIVKEEYKELKY